MFKKKKIKKYGLAQFYELFQVLQEVFTKMNFSESNVLEVYAVVHYRIRAHQPLCWAAHSSNCTKAYYQWY